MVASPKDMSKHVAGRRTPLHFGVFGSVKTNVSVTPQSPETEVARSVAPSRGGTGGTCSTLLGPRAPSRVRRSSSGATPKERTSPPERHDGGWALDGKVREGVWGMGISDPKGE